jgi:hypothetical protein
LSDDRQLVTGLVLMLCGPPGTGKTVASCFIILACLLCIVVFLRCIVAFLIVFFVQMMY